MIVLFLYPAILYLLTGECNPFICRVITDTDTKDLSLTFYYLPSGGCDLSGIFAFIAYPCKLVLIHGDMLCLSLFNVDESTSDFCFAVMMKLKTSHK